MLSALNSINMGIQVYVYMYICVYIYIYIVILTYMYDAINARIHTIDVGMHANELHPRIVLRLSERRETDGVFAMPFLCGCRTALET